MLEGDIDVIHRLLRLRDVPRVHHTPLGQGVDDGRAGNERWNVYGAVLFHQVERSVFQEAAVLDGINAGEDGAAGALVAVGVRGGLLALRMGLIDYSVELILGKLRRIHVVIGAEDPARGTDLDHIGTVFDRVANRGSEFGRRIGNALGNAGLESEQVGTESVAGVAMAAGGAQALARHNHARAVNDAAPDGIAKGDIFQVRVSQVTYCGKPGKQSPARIY